MRVLVTGGAGFIGSHLVDALVDAGDDVVVLDNLVTGYQANVHPAARLVIGDVADRSAVAAALDASEVVFHLAAARAVLRSVQAPLETDRANTAGTLTVLEAARQAGARRVVSTSSSSVYGGASVTPTPETAPLVPRSPYAVSKLAGEQYARVYWELHGLETVSLRLFNVFGPRQRPDSAYAAVIPIFIDALRDRVPPRVHGDGLQSRDFTYVSDTVAAYLAAGRAPAERCAGRVYNVAAGGEHSLLDLLAALGGIIGAEVDPLHVEPRAGDVRHSCADFSAAHADLGWTPEVGFEDGLARTVEWFAGRQDPPGSSTQ
ncbi:MAG: NAD-dependent epimerase/dehydratase family protein [Acidimicrobiales bacterium]